MANQGAKKRKDENDRHLAWLRKLVIIASAVHMVFRFAVFHASLSWLNWVGLALSLAAYKLCYGGIAYLAQPTYDDNGELIDGGYDLSMGGMCGYYHDIIYITSFVHVMGILSDKVWYVYVAVPVFAAYKFWQLVLYPYIFEMGGGGEEEDEKSRKKREKAERKGSRTKFVRSRR
ncbi:hypothetical protein CBR_g3690 [Chara braunii]|uniref:Transmembrane protein 208 n=1 Tax=Chara braunii TaxID=69332 RepID=A0A388KG22_CHABU|nr:hypothetical protein CBR_g3690 [Chara braunii]|eukprot:GBG68991.1 hypothetical protein CBR_g3690 [Chara braunii]